MAIRSFSYLRFALSAALIGALSACQTYGPKRPGTRVGGQESNAPKEAGTPIEQPLPPITKEEPKKVAVILGPGGAKALAHVGVLRALQEQRIPIGKVIGLEWGALI